MADFSSFSTFLRKNKYTSQFLISKFRTELEYRNAIEEGVLKVFTVDSRISGVLFRSENSVLHVLGIPPAGEVQSFTTESLQGLNGPRSVVEAVLPMLSQKVRKAFHDFVYRLQLPSNPQCKGLGVARSLNRNDFIQWHSLYCLYLSELGLISTATEEARLKRFEGEVSKGWHWGTFVGDRLVSIAAYNAKASDSAQLGGVFTLPTLRGQGYSTTAMLELISHSSADATMRELILFTDPPNSKSGRLYVKLGFETVDTYSMIVFC